MRAPLLRRAALFLVTHAGRTLPARHAFWAEGMMQEAAHIGDDWAAFCWSLGCVLASYRAIAGAMARAAARVLVALLLFYFAYDNLLGPAQAIGCYVHASQSAMNFLATLPSDRIVCVSWPTIPPALQFLSLAAGGLYVMAGIALLRNRRIVFRLFAAAFLAGLIVFGWVQAVPAVHAYWSSLLFETMMMHAALGHALIPLLAASGIWLSISAGGVSAVRALPHSRK